MSHRRSTPKEVLRIVLPIVVLLVGVAGFMLLSSLKQKPAGADDGGDEVPVVETRMVELHAGGLDIEASGMVVPFREITLSAEVGGRIDFKSELCRAGKYVEKDAELIRIDSRDYELQVARLERELTQAEASLIELTEEIRGTAELVQVAGQQLVVQHREYDRQVKLGGVVAPSELDRAKRELLTAQNTELTLKNQLTLLETRRGRLDAAKALVQTQLDKAQLDLERTTIRAPVSGVIVNDLVEQDYYVQVGTSLFTIEDTSQVEVKCSLRKEDVRWLWLSQDRRSILADAQPGAAYEIPESAATVTFRMMGVQYAWQGKLSRYEGIGLDAQTRTIPCRVLVTDPRAVEVQGATDDVLLRAGPRALMRGMYVTVKIHVDPSLQLLRVPERAIRPGNYIWLTRGGKLLKQRVQIAQSIDEDVVVYADRLDLVAGDRVVVSPLNFAQEGLSVREKAAS